LVVPKKSVLKGRWKYDDGFPASLQDVIIFCANDPATS
jgi:hypothetical protein